MSSRLSPKTLVPLGAVLGLTYVALKTLVPMLIWAVEARTQLDEQVSEMGDIRAAQAAYVQEFRKGLMGLHEDIAVMKEDIKFIKQGVINEASRHPAGRGSVSREAVSAPTTEYERLPHDPSKDSL